MLTCLRIDNVAIVTHTELELGPGMNVLTGPTGAGKSILITALGLVLGDRAGPGLVRAGADRAQVEALFEPGESPTLRARLRALDLPADDDQIVVRRVVLASGRTRASVNGHLTTLTQLRTLAAGLVDISSQHEHHTLVDPSTHLGYLDAFAAHPDDIAAVRDSWRRASEARRQLSALHDRLSDRADREDLLRWQLGEIDRVDPQPGEMADLEQELRRLAHGGALSDATRGGARRLLHREQPETICSELAQLEAELGAAVHHDDALRPLVERVASARIDLEDLGADLDRYAGGVPSDPGRQAEVDDRLGALKRLAKRHGGDLGAVLERRAEATRELELFDDSDREVERLQAAAAEALHAAGSAAEALSTTRRDAASRLGAAIASELATLGMGGAEVQIRVDPLQGGDSELAWQGARLTERGCDRAELLIAPNPGEPPRPLRKVASGGELSRSLLAIKRVLAGLGPVGLYVFDEVDAGVGGEVAEAIGHKLAEVAAHHQVLCITHLPQIASFADHHFVVHKQVQGERTHSELTRLSDGERVDELARMLGGKRITKAQRQAAHDLLTQQGRP